MQTYRTKAGDTWDLIALDLLGSEKYAVQLINANREFVDVIVFSAGVTLQIPDVNYSSITANLPPWRK